MLTNKTITEVSFEAAYEEADKLENREDFHGEGATVIKGVHPDWGAVMIIIPPLGKSIYTKLNPLPNSEISEVKAVVIPQILP